MPDNLTPDQRRYCMSRVKSKDTRLELRVRSALHSRGLRFRKHVSDLPGKPDVVFARARVAVFIDGDFWHGYKFDSWQHKMSKLWREKISRNRARDIKYREELRKMGWNVLRVWQHEVETDLDSTIARIVVAVRGSTQDPPK